MCGPTQIFWPDRFNRFDVYRSQTNRHPDKHSTSIDAMLKFFIDQYCDFSFFFKTCTSQYCSKTCTGSGTSLYKFVTETMKRITETMKRITETMKRITETMKLG